MAEQSGDYAKEGKVAKRPRANTRELKKRENLARIKNAARESFSSRIFADVTIREIASIANVGVATIFRYAKNKQGLLLLTVIDDIDATLDTSEAGIQSDAPLSTNLMKVLQPPFSHMGNPDWPALAQVFQRELPFYETGEYAQRFRTQRQRLLALLGKCVDQAVKTDEIARPSDASAVVWIIFVIYQAELRAFSIAQNVPLSQALNKLEASLTLFIHGLVHPRS